MKSAKETKSLVQILGLSGAETVLVRDNSTVKIHRYADPNGAYCRVVLADAKKGFSQNGIIQNISKLVRASAYPAQLGPDTRTSFVGHYVKPAGSVMVRRKNGEVSVGRTTPDKQEMARRLFTVLEMSFKRARVQLESLKVRFGRTVDGGLRVMNLYGPDEWELTRDGKRLADPHSSPEALSADYAALDEITSYFS